MDTLKVSIMSDVAAATSSDELLSILIKHAKIIADSTGYIPTPENYFNMLPVEQPVEQSVEQSVEQPVEQPVEYESGDTVSIDIPDCPREQQFGVIVVANGKLYVHLSTDFMRQTTPKTCGQEELEVGKVYVYKNSHIVYVMEKNVYQDTSCDYLVCQVHSVNPCNVNRIYAETEPTIVKYLRK